ncbi:hypothetical protein [Streptomyces olivochromogenes]|uniref:DUF4145 domain-containing protein n=1 Tax=Streptomyces olivochromogenes TaxID=1963 RepID=A0A250VP93_STROL|nr:hypothetical protein [Streptomyces olivochromogenes]KUN43424.1 hypothetical protein AQJ27_30590 [Streptomyces olivochromogenes]GAX55790.1 hypothetical protein SO3561_07352 [Streptomyces olivochromogenes]
MDDSLSFESFLAAARTAAQKAMDDHARGEYDEFALHGGVAFEKLAKAVLVSKNPAYLVEMRNGNSDMLLYLCGDVDLDAKKVRTVGASEAIARLRRMKVLPQDEQLDQLIALRNGTAHTTVGDEAKALLPTLAENVETLLKHIGQPMDAFWGRWTSAVNVAVDKERDEIQREVEIKIKQARHLFDDRFKGLPDGAKDGVLGVPPAENGRFWVGDMTVLNGDDVLLVMSQVKCPACTATAMMTLVPTDRMVPRPNFVPEGFICHLCGLNLQGREEMAACGELASVGRKLVSIPPLAEAYARRSAVRLGETRTG